MAPKSTKGSKVQTKPPDPPKPPIEYPTIAAKLEAEYQASRPYQTLAEQKGFENLNKDEKAKYANAVLLESGAWRSWSVALQKEFWKTVEGQKIPIPLLKPRDLGKDPGGVEIGKYTPAEYKLYQRRQRELEDLRGKSDRFREKREFGKITQEDIEEERNRRKLIGNLRGKKMVYYEGHPDWDDVVPLAQDDGEDALAAIAYTDEYAEAMGYLRAIMAAKEHSERVLELTEHIISMNAAHYTVWLYRSQVLLALKSDIAAELEWVNQIALENQKNYQIWHHRQILITYLYDEVAGDAQKIKELADSETAFMKEMFHEDAKNYHVWSYRQWLVRKLDLFNESELRDTEELLLRDDVRNNSAWSHRFFLVFSDPKHCTPDSRATETDLIIPSDIIDREIEFAKSKIFEAPQNQSSWNYLKGVLKKGGRPYASEECFASEFAKIDGEEEDVKSSHALDFLAECWLEKGEKEKAGKALTLLGSKYDVIRKNYWEWRRGAC